VSSLSNKLNLSDVTPPLYPQRILRCQGAQDPQPSLLCTMIPLPISLIDVVCTGAAHVMNGAVSHVVASCSQLQPLRILCWRVHTKFTPVVGATLPIQVDTACAERTQFTPVVKATLPVQVDPYSQLYMLYNGCRT